MNRRILCLTFCLAYLLSNLTASADSATPTSLETPKFKIGALIPLSGNFASYGETVRQGILKANTPAIEWVFEDEGCEPAPAVAAYKKLTTVDQLSFIVGPCCGSPQTAVAPMLKNRQQIAMLPNAAASSVYESSGRNMYSVQYSLEDDGVFLANTLNERGLKRVAIVYVDNDFSQAIEKGFLSAYKGSVAIALHPPGFDTNGMKDAALKLKNLDFDSILVPDASPMMLGFFSELKKIGVAPRPAFSVYAAQLPELIEVEGRNVDGLFYSYPDVPESVDGIGYFATVAAQQIGDLVTNCKGVPECVSKALAENPRFQPKGVLQGKIILKTIQNGKFVRLDGKQS